MPALVNLVAWRISFDYIAEDAALLIGTFRITTPSSQLRTNLHD